MTRPLRLLFETLAKLLTAMFFVLTSAYFFLAHVPYTNFFLIQAPPYPWMTWFAHTHSILYWAVLVMIFIQFRKSSREPLLCIALTILGLMGIWLTVGSVLQVAGTDGKSYAWSIAILLPFILIQVSRLRTKQSTKRNTASFSYVNALVVAAMIALFSALGIVVRSYVNAHQYSASRQQLDLLLWMLAAHLCVAVIAVSLANVILAALLKFRAQVAVRRWLCVVLGFLMLSIALSNYVKMSLAFNGWKLYAYVIPLSFALCTALASILWPLLDSYKESSANNRLVANTFVLAISGIVALAALCLPTFIGGADWNSIIQYSFNATFWLVVGVAVYLVRPDKQRYTMYGIIAATLVAVCAYGGLEYSSLLWARALGSTPSEIQAAVRTYTTVNSSFGMMYSTLHPEPVVRCGDFCRILRQCTNMQDTIAKRDLDLVANLERSGDPHPNIFLIVVDSMRPDYLGAYNPKVDFTPNLDRFARDSVVMHRAFTSYAGTSLSEASIFAGALLLHSHYPQPFNRENSLRKLAQADGYQLLVSDDPIVRQVMDPSDVKLDRGKAWNEVELAETYRQLGPFLDAHASDKRPILLYTQPQNVHQGTSNRLADMSRENWQSRPGFDKVTAYRVHEVDTIFGRIVADLKSRGIYDNSIIILTADHGDGLPESVCHGHNIEICPEVLRVPLIIHLPQAMLRQVMYDDTQVATPTDIMPTLYYLLGHRPIEHETVFGRPLFTNTREEFESYRRKDLFFASDARPAYGLLLDNAKYMYLTYDSPPQSFFYDLSLDPDGRHNLITPEITERNNRRLIEYLFAIGKFYGYTPTGGRDAL